ncbi:hypothetical protein AAVH_15295 [Aphelenchoides avenae]|nr:hypothetical protein AAVH_15295 [Aphelenchus avenae]
MRSLIALITIVALAIHALAEDAPKPPVRADPGRVQVGADGRSQIKQGPLMGALGKIATTGLCGCKMFKCNKDCTEDCLCHYYEGRGFVCGTGTCRRR